MLSALGLFWLLCRRVFSHGCLFLNGHTYASMAIHDMRQDSRGKREAVIVLSVLRNILVTNFLFRISCNSYFLRGVLSEAHPQFRFTSYFPQARTENINIFTYINLLSRTRTRYQWFARSARTKMLYRNMPNNSKI